MTDVEIPDDVLRAGAVSHFVTCIENGCDVRFAEMLALRQAPRVMTDDVMMSGIGNLDQQIKDPDYLDRICKTSMRHGYKPKVSDFYNAAIAAFPGDPAAFINHGQGRGHIKKTMEQRGYKVSSGVGTDALVGVEVREPEVDPWDKSQQVKLAPSMVEKIRKKKIRENPDLGRKNQRELRESIIDKHGAK